MSLKAYLRVPPGFNSEPWSSFFNSVGGNFLCPLVFASASSFLASDDPSCLFVSVAAQGRQLLWWILSKAECLPKVGEFHTVS